MKRVLIISGSPRKNGSTAKLVERFAQGASDAGMLVETVELRSKKIGYCMNCNYCRRNKTDCIIADDAREIVEKALQCDVLVLATPVYFYNVTAQLKTLIDRFYAREHEFRDLPEKDCYYIITNAGFEQHQDSTVTVLDGFIACLRNVKVRGMVQATRVTNAEEISTECLNRAYELGKNC